MNLFQRRRLKKQLKHILHDARHARHMREDLESAEKIDALLKKEQALKDAWSQGALDQIESIAEQVIQQTTEILPPKKNPRVREYVEILVVAIGVAMAFRTYFVQPFKIPTGSMEPTLFGIKAEAQVGRGIMDYLPLNLVNLALFGDRYVEIKAARNGVVEQLVRDDPYIRSLNGVVPPIRMGLAQHFEVGEYVTKGQLLASGRVRSGDHIFVNKVRYNFKRPERGDVFVFSTDGVTHPQVQADTFYIKRLVGMPGESISIDAPFLVADGKRVLEPDVFRRQVFDQALGYAGFVFPPRDPRDTVTPLPVLADRRSVLKLSDTEYLPMGDNSLHSLDGRYFGGIERDNIVGPAVTVYWPLSQRWGRIR